MRFLTDPRSVFAAGLVVAVLVLLGDAADAGCPSGTFLDVGRGECWSCPEGYSRTAYPVTSVRACERPRLTAKAVRHQRGTGLIKTDCPDGQFLHALNGYCYSCPSGLKRTVHPIDSKNACEVERGVFSKATKSAVKP
jgi:hypothetical protein